MNEEILKQMGFRFRDRSPYENVWRYSLPYNRYFVLRVSRNTGKFYFDSHYGGIRAEIKSPEQLKILFAALIGQQI